MAQKTALQYAPARAPAAARSRRETSRSQLLESWLQDAAMAFAEATAPDVARASGMAVAVAAARW